MASLYDFPGLSMDKTSGLKKTKRLALCLLIIASVVFISTLFLPQSLTVQAIKSVAEASMVGALADWFAVSALFHRIPLPLIGRHTAIIPRNKQRIADNLGRFVEEKFLSTDSMIALLRRQAPAEKLAGWLVIPDNAGRLSRLVCQLIAGFLNAGNDQHIRRFLRQGILRAIDSVDFRHTAVLLLESMTRENRHQALLDALIEQVVRVLDNPESRQFIAGQISRWFRQEYPTMARLVSVEWLGEKGADKVTSMIDALLLDVAQDQHHQLRDGVNRSVNRFIDALKNDPQMQRRAEQLKTWLKEDETFNQYTVGLWDDLRRWLTEDMQREDSATARQIRQATQWAGEALQNDPQLRASLNQHLEQAALQAGPEFARFLTRHISDTIKSWDNRQLSAQIEQNIGRDLQFIRINGTLVGGLLGLLLFGVSQLPLFIQYFRQWLPG